MVRRASLVVALFAFAGVSYADCGASHDAKQGVTTDEVQASVPATKSALPAAERKVLACQGAGCNADKKVLACDGDNCPASAAGARKVSSCDGSNCSASPSVEKKVAANCTTSPCN